MGWKDMRFFNYKLLIMGKTVRIVQYFPIGKIFFPSWKKKIRVVQNLQTCNSCRPLTPTHARALYQVYLIFSSPPLLQLNRYSPLPLFFSWPLSVMRFSIESSVPGDIPHCSLARRA